MSPPFCSIFLSPDRRLILAAFFTGGVDDHHAISEPQSIDILGAAFRITNQGEPLKKKKNPCTRAKSLDTAFSLRGFRGFVSISMVQRTDRIWIWFVPTAEAAAVDEAAAKKSRAGDKRMPALRDAAASDCGYVIEYSNKYLD
ncbi:hypothetical protein TIFTF001_022243 [Ficus carica]|uniref:Uncharacterized protein n=1 Tax=Ficus carica TaxID=3494 RepID=A0AA88DFC5_FICCA|nr:hypothetical protein TIFTF001_022243 [Ficus carica]